MLIICAVPAGVLFFTTISAFTVLDLAIYVKFLCCWERGERRLIHELMSWTTGVNLYKCLTDSSCVVQDSFVGSFTQRVCTQLIL